MITNDITLPNRSAGNNRHVIPPVEGNILNVALLPVPPAAVGWLLIKLVSCSFLLLHGSSTGSTGGREVGVILVPSIYGIAARVLQAGGGERGLLCSF